MPADVTGLINLNEAQRASLSIDWLQGTFKPCLIRFGVFVINGHVVVDLTVEEAREVIAQFESVIKAIANEVDEVMS